MSVADSEILGSQRILKRALIFTPYEYICKIWTSEPKHFRLDPLHQMPGLLYSAG
jgi:hypothetical protein